MKHVSCSQKNPVLMIFDGHKSHTKSLELIDYARENGLFLLSLPPHTTHKLQPLDRAVFKPLKSYFNNACQKWMRNHPGRRIQIENLGELFRESYLKSATLENAVSSFQTSGIVPFNSDIVPADEYIEDPRGNISIATTLTDGNTKIPTNETSICDQSQSNEQIPCTSDNIAGIPKTSTTTQTMENNKTTENQVYFEIDMTSTALDKSVKKKNVSFEEILKVPKLVNITNKRGEKSEIITSCPYKRKLKKDQGTKTKKIKKETKPKGQKAGANLKTKKKHSDKKKHKSSEKEKPFENQEWTCAVCKGSWRKTRWTGLSVESVLSGYMKTVQ